ncbi:MAG: patatin-like phospholipase family protein [Spirochaetia bacterium]|nr:patatin-like phospholipase family protein [Spirochaetia bacterium]
MKKREIDNYPEIGLALGGGGARGYAHVGVLKALRAKANNLPIHIAGTSAGAIIAACYAAEVPQPILEKSAGEFGWFQHVISLADTTKHVFALKREGGMLSNAALADTMNTLLDGRGFDDLPINLALTASDLNRKVRVIFTSKEMAILLEQNREVLENYLLPPDAYHNGFTTEIISDINNIGLAVRASSAVPGVFQPVEINGYHLVDGGVLDQVPVDVVKAMGSSHTIGVSLGMAMVVDQLSSAFTTFNKTIEALAIPQIRKSLDLADLGFQIAHIETKSPIKLHQMDLIDQGEREMQNYMNTVDWL